MGSGWRFVWNEHEPRVEMFACVGLVVLDLVGDVGGLGNNSTTSIPSTTEPRGVEFSAATANLSVRNLIRYSAKWICPVRNSTVDQLRSFAWLVVVRSCSHPLQQPANSWLGQKWKYTHLFCQVVRHNRARSLSRTVCGGLIAFVLVGPAKHSHGIN